MKLPRLDPRIYAATLAVAVVFAGAMSGSAIGSTPIIKRAGDAIPEAPRNGGVGEFELDTSGQPPDHYPLVTPTGRVPVAALAMHGRLRDTRGGWWDRPDHVPLAAAYKDDYDEAQIDQLVDWQPPVRKVRRENAVRVHTPDAVRVEVVEGATEPRKAAPSEPRHSLAGGALVELATADVPTANTDPNSADVSIR